MRRHAREEAQRKAIARERTADAFGWIYSDADDGPFSFVNVYETLGIDAAWLRGQVRKRGG